MYISNISQINNYIFYSINYERLKDLRRDKGLKQTEIAKILNISTTCYAGYEQGYREPNADMIIKICNYFEVSADFLLGMEDENGIKTIQQNSTTNEGSSFHVDVHDNHGIINNHQYKR